MVLTTHYLEEAERLADRIVVLRDGRVIAEGTPRTLGARDRAATLITFTDAGGALARAALSVVAADLHRLTAEACARGHDLADLEVRRPTLEDVYLELTDDAPTPEEPAVIRHTLRYELLALRRNKRARIFTLAFPVLLLSCCPACPGTRPRRSAATACRCSASSCPASWPCRSSPPASPRWSR